MCKCRRNYDDINRRNREREGGGLFNRRSPHLPSRLLCFLLRIFSGLIPFLTSSRDSVKALKAQRDVDNAAFNRKTALRVGE